MVDLTNQDQFMLGRVTNYVSTPTNDRPITPDNKLSEGIDSVGQYLAAPWLPTVRFDNDYQTHIVITSGKPLAHATDAKGNQFIVPAGYAIALAENDTDIVYTAEDVRLGLKNANGEEVTAGMSVVAGMTAAGVKVSNFCGIANYNIFRHPGGDGVNPTMLNYYNFNPQPNISYNMDYAYQFPMVKDKDALNKSPLVGVSAFVGESAYAGQFITYDKHSNYKVTAEDDFTFAGVTPERIIGQVSRVIVAADPKTGESKNKYNIDHVVNTPYTGSGVNTMPGVRTNGLPTIIHYANGYGVIHFNCQTR